jgi:ribosomal protein S18 acetylase RimI-like enzyme
MKISAATTYDVETVCQVDYSVIGNDSRRGYLAHAVEDGKCFVAQTNDAIAGFVIYDTTFYENAFIWLVIVSPDFRRQGVATALIRHVETICKTDKLFTSTNESNTAMQHLCESLGFIKSGMIDNLDEGDPEVVYFKRVGNRHDK